MRTTLALVLLAANGLGQAQSPYRPFPESNAGWVETHSMWDFTMGSEYSETCEYTIESGTDTTINDTVYRELRMRGLCESSWQDQWWLAEETFCWFRQDLVGRKVFVFNPEVQHGVLWFDFNLPVGLYPATWGHESSSGVEVVALDSVELNDGWHRTWVLWDPQGGSGEPPFGAVIEGVGSTLGLNPLHGLVYPFEWGDQMDCHSVNGSGIYPFGATECDLTMHAPAPALPFAELRVMPNPAQEAIWLDLEPPPTNGARYRILDQAGRQVSGGALNSAAVSRLDVSALDAGLYTLRYEATGGTPWTTRFIKE